MGIPDQLTCLLRNLYAVQEARVRTGHGTINWFKIGKGVCQDCILSLCLFNLYTEYIIQNASWMKQKLESRLPGEISITSDMQMTPLSWQKAKRSYRAYWWRWKRRGKKTTLKLSIQQMKIMASGPITSCQIDGETIKTVTDFIFLGSKTTADGEYSHETN